MSSNRAERARNLALDGRNRLQGLVGLMPIATQDLRREYLNWREEADRLLRADPQLSVVDRAALESARHRDLVQDNVPPDQMYREVALERDRILPLLDAVGSHADLAVDEGEWEEVVTQAGNLYKWDRRQPLGCGLQGNVYEGRTGGGTPVAIKVVALRTDTTTRWYTDLRLAEREWDVGRALLGDNSTHVLPVIDGVERDDALILIMPLAEGSVADRLIERGKFSEPETHALLLEVATGLVQLAKRGVIHRDLKPRNILNWQSRWAIADFGVSRILSEPTSTYTWAQTGTLEYWAPELFSGAPATVQSDLYALGCVAVEALTGKPAFGGPDLAESHRNRLPTIPQLEDPALERVISGLLNKEAAGRPSDAREVVETLSRPSDLAEDQQGLMRIAAAASGRALVESQRRVTAEQTVVRRNAARAALTRIWDLTVDRARQAVSGAVADHSGIDRFLVLGDARLDVRITEPASDPHGLLLIGQVKVHARESVDPTFPANLVCSWGDGCPAWELVTARANAASVDRVAVGPSRENGVGGVDLDALERVWLSLGQKFPAAVITRTPLTAAALIEIFVAEVDAGPPWL